MKKIKYVLIFIATLVVLFVASLIAARDLHSRYVEAAVNRVQSGGSDITVEELDNDSSLFSLNKVYLVKLFDGAASFSIYVNTSFLPFVEKNEVWIRNFDGRFFSCDGCNFRDMVVEGYFNVNYFSNSYDGELQMSSFNTRGNKNFLTVSGFSSNIYGSFADRILHVGAKLDRIDAGNEDLKTSTIIKRIVGDLNVQFRDGVALVATKLLQPVKSSAGESRDQSYISIGQYSFTNRSTGVKVGAENVNLSFDSQPGLSDPNKVDITQYIQAKSFKYDNPDLNTDLNLKRSDINLNVRNATQHYWVEFARIIGNFIALGKGTASEFDYDVMKDLQKNGTRIDIDRLQLVTDASAGIFRIKKGSYIAFDASRNSNVKDGLDLSIDFNLNSNFIKDFPSGDDLKQMFLSRDWLLHGAMDSKDEYSTKLTVRKGKCSLGENMLPDC